MRLVIVIVLLGVTIASLIVFYAFGWITDAEFQRYAAIASIAGFLLAAIAYLAPPNNKDRPDRPDLYIRESGLKHPLAPNRTMGIALTFSNAGKATGYDLVLPVSVFVVLTPVSTCTFCVSDSPTVMRTGPLRSQENRTASMEFSPPPGREAFQALMSGKAVLIIGGKGKYKDEKGKEFPIEFCLMYEPSHGPVLSHCPQGISLK